MTDQTGVLWFCPNLIKKKLVRKYEAKQNAELFRTMQANLKEVIKIKRWINGLNELDNYPISMFQKYVIEGIKKLMPLKA